MPRVTGQPAAKPLPPVAVVCEACEGSGKSSRRKKCPACKGTGKQMIDPRSLAAPVEEPKVEPPKFSDPYAVLAWAVEPVPDRGAASTWSVWCDRTGLYMIVRAVGLPAADPLPDWFATQHRPDPTGTAWRSVEADPKLGSGYSRYYRTLEAALDAAERFHAARAGLETVPTNRAEVLAHARGKGLDVLPAIVARRTRKAVAPPQIVEEAAETGQDMQTPANGQARAASKEAAGQPSNKELVWRGWAADKAAAPETLHKLCGGRVELSTVRGWTKQWAWGNNLPACAK